MRAMYTASTALFTVWAEAGRGGGRWGGRGVGGVAGGGGDRRWGPKKPGAILTGRGGDGGPAASTIGDLLRREGLSQPRRRSRYVVPLTAPLAAATAPN